MEKRIYGEVRAANNTITGRIPYNSLSVDLGGFKEKLKAGCFADSLSNGQTVFAYWSHEDSKPLASTSNNSLRIKDRTDGLHFSITPAKTSWGKDVLELVKSGVIRGASFGFRCKKDSWQETEDGNIRTVERAILYEISPVSQPAYEETSVRRKGYNNMSTKELREQRARLLEEMRALNDSGLDTAEKREQYDQMDADFEKITREIRLQEREDQLSTSRGHIPLQVSDDEDFSNISKKVFRNTADDVTFWLPGTYRAPNWSDSEIRDVSKKLGYSTRDLQTDSDTAGGYTVQSEQFSEQIIAAKMDMVFVRKLATIITVREATSLGAPALSSEPDDPAWTSELGIGGDPDSSMDFDKRSLTPHPLARSIKVSKTLVRRNPRIADFVRQRLAYKFSVVEENAFLNGTGINSPLGVFVSSDSGISTSRDISDGNTSTAITGDGLHNCVMNLKKQYRNSSSLRWVFHRDAIKMIRKLKSGDGQYLFQPGLVKDQPDRILGYPYEESEYAPNTFTTGKLVGIIGDWSYYWIVDALSMEFQVATELLIETNQNLIVGRAELDGMPVLEEAWSRLKLA